MNPFTTPPTWDTTSKDEMQAWQLRRLRHYLRTRVLPFGAHYRRLFREHDIHPEDLATWDDWARVPFTSKVNLTVPREQQRDLVLIPDESALRHEPALILHALMHGRTAAKERAEDEFRPVLLTSTTGRSSDPVPFLYTKHDLHNLDITGRRIMQVGGSQRDFRHVNLFPYAPHLAFWQTHHAGLAFGTFVVSSGGGKTLGTEGNMSLIDKIQPDIIIGMPTFIYHMMRLAVESKRTWPNLKRIVLGGEKVAEGLRAKLRELADQLGSENAHVLSTYGFTEAKLAMPECPSHTGVGISGFHLSPDLGIIELVHPVTGLPVEPGQSGEIVYTPLDARGTVVLRYRTGDIAEGGLTWEACPHCGRRCPRLLGPISRVSEVRELNMDKLKGTLVNFNLLEHLLDDQRGIAAWQLEIRKLNDDPNEVDEIHLHIAPEPRANPDDLTRLVHQRFSEVTEVNPNEIHFEDLPTLRDRLGLGRLIKEQKILDSRPRPSPERPATVERAAGSPEPAAQLT
jgi:phenylacetate-coenzyme A ligase PaaK-like adenylate-forming protein